MSQKPGLPERFKSKTFQKVQYSSFRVINWETKGSLNFNSFIKALIMKKIILQSSDYLADRYDENIDKEAFKKETKDWKQNS